MSDIERMLQIENKQFNWAMEQINKKTYLKGTIERLEPTKLSRQSCHKIINSLSERVIHDQIKLSKGPLAGLLENLPKHDDLKSHPFVQKAFNVLIKLGVLKEAEEFVRHKAETVDAEALGHGAWRLASGNVDDRNFIELFKIPTTETILHSMVVYFVQDRYKRFRGFDKNKMAPHTAYQIMMIQAQKGLMKKFGAMPQKNPSDMTEKEIEHWRTNFAITALTFIVYDLNKSSLRSL